MILQASNIWSAISVEVENGVEPTYFFGDDPSETMTNKDQMTTLHCLSTKRKHKVFTV